MTHPLTPNDLIQLKSAGKKIACLTAYDYPWARLLDDVGMDIVLVGDSLGMVVLGYPDTTHVTMEDMLHHCRAVTRGVKKALVVGDLPYGSYDTPEDAVANARRLMTTGVHAIKLEGAELTQIRAIVDDGIPVMAHLGMLPQQVNKEGGYKVKGRSEKGAQHLLADALAVEEAGAFAVVLEIIVPEVATRLSTALKIPTIGIGSGDACDGQILVTHDLVGAFPWFAPKFVTPEAALGADFKAAVQRYIRRTKD